MLLENFYIFVKTYKQSYNKTQNNKTMTREEITTRVHDISEQLLALGDNCTSQHFEENEQEYRTVLYLLGEYCRHAGFQLGSFSIHTRY